MKFILIALGVILIPDLYIWYTFIRGNQWGWNLLYWLPLVLIVLSLLLAFFGGIGQSFFMRLFFGLLLCVSVPKLVFTLVSLLGNGVSWFAPIAAQGANLLGLLFGVVSFVGALYGFTVGWKKLTIHEVTIESNRIPQSFDGYRLVQLSDLHIGTYHGSLETVDKLVHLVNGLKPDAVLFTGDLVNLEPSELAPFMQSLNQFETKDGVFSIMGNHDYCTYGPNNTPLKADQNTLKLQEMERELGWDLLLNESRMIYRGGDSIAVVGVENDGEPPFPSHADMGKALQGVSADTYKVLLSHDPSHWRREVLPTTNIDLTLSGHTHSMQFRIGNFSPSMWTHAEWGGMYEEEGRKLYVNTGTGSNLPFRLGAWPEVTLITLKSKP
ncbi:MAG: metallophosphoesterase [Phocaeicola sp.]